MGAASFLFRATLAVNPAAERLEKEQPEISNPLDTSLKKCLFVWSGQETSLFLKCLIDTHDRYGRYLGLGFAHFVPRMTSHDISCISFL